MPFDAKANNKFSSFTKEERKNLKLEGLLPYRVFNQKEEINRILENLEQKTTEVEKYLYLSHLREVNESLFFKFFIDHMEKVMPIMYTPTIGEICLDYSRIVTEPKGFYITPEDKGSIKKNLDNWLHKDVCIIVITDGQRILGLGDLGANGMGIPIGKLALYSACGGVHPDQCMPVMFDVGTDNETLLEDEFYSGYPHNRIKNKAYLELMDEFITAVKEKFPRAVIQFEDFNMDHAFNLLNLYRNKACCFNDDIQGTAAVTLAGIYASLKITNHSLVDKNILFLGAGSAAVGIADLIVLGLMKEGLKKEDAYKKIYMVNSRGLVVKKMEGISDKLKPYAHDLKPMSFIEAIDHIKPKMLIGVTGKQGVFTEDIIKKMAIYNRRPVIFALSNPTKNAECTAEQAYNWSDGRAVFASGSPFGLVEYKDTLIKPGQCNNAYIFPGMGLGVAFCQAKNIPDELFLIAAQTLSESVTWQNLSNGMIFPSLKRIREVSLKIAHAVADKCYELEIAQRKKPKNLLSELESCMYDPTY